MSTTWGFGTTTNKVLVQYDADHLLAHRGVIDLLPECFERLGDAREHIICKSIDMDRIVGKSDCVATSDADEIVYAQRYRRRGLTRFVKNRESVPSSHVTVIMKKIKPDRYVVLTAFVGQLAQREPWDRTIKNSIEQVASLLFWKNHALVWGSQEVVGQPTTLCPWSSHDL